MVLVKNKYKNTLVDALISFVTHSSPSCYVTLRTQVMRLNLVKVRGPFVQTLCIEKDSYMDAI